MDSSSGAIGTAVNRAIEALVPIIANPIVPNTVRQKWLERLWEAVEQDNMPYIEHLVSVSTQFDGALITIIDGLICAKYVLHENAASMPQN